ncbi:MAG: hypothetical protein WCA78_15420 [Rhizomicrobium sp.]
MRRALLTSSLSLLVAVFAVPVPAAAETWVLAGTYTYPDGEVEQMFVDTDSVTTNPDGSVYFRARNSHFPNSAPNEYVVRCDQDFSGEKIALSSNYSVGGGWFSDSADLTSLIGQAVRFVCHK